MKPRLLLSMALWVGFAAAHAGDSKIAAEAVNALGVDLYHARAGGEANVLLSPFGIQSALAMTYAGADGDTRTEMQRALHYPDDENLLHDGFAALAQQLAELATASIDRARADQQAGKPALPLEFHLANRLVGQRGCQFQEPFLKVLQTSYAARPEEMDFKADPEKARLEINRWVQVQTAHRIHDFMGASAITPNTRLALIDAFYLRAPWPERQVRNERFLVHGREGVSVPTLMSLGKCGYAKGNGMQIIACPYEDPTLQFVIAVPDNPGGLAVLERGLTSKLIGEWVNLEARPILLHLPKFKIAPPTMALVEDLKALGMKTAFDDPAGSANLGRMAARQPDNYLALSAVWHRTYLAIDEKGTEAAAVGGFEAAALGEPVVPVKVVPIEVRVDRPFLFAIQHVPSGACLFIGRVTDPR